MVVKAGHENVVELRAKSRKGRLRVSEAHSWALQVEVDGKDVGVSPWQGLVDPGEHRVRLHGFVNVATIAECAATDVRRAEVAQGALDGAKVATKVEAATVALFGEAAVMLAAEEQDASLRIESAPAGAAVRIDAVEVGKTPWEGRLALGEHAIELRASGFLLAKQAVRLERRKQREISVLLQPIPDEAREARNLGAGVAFGVGAVGLGVFGATGALALAKRNELRSICGGIECTEKEQASLATADPWGRHRR